MRNIFVSAGLISLAFAATPASAAPWVRGYVVDAYEPAFYFGGKLSQDDLGTDCPKGAVPDNDYAKILKTSWRSDAEVKKLMTPVEGREPGGIMAPGLSYRGFRPDIETYINPFAAPDPGFQQVTGKIAEGFNLDNNPRTGFSGTKGEAGIDNNFYRVMGCTLTYRGAPWKGYLSERSTDKMVDGHYTMVIRVSGNQDPMNDADAVVEVGYSPDQMVKDPMGKVTPDYSYRLAKSAQFTKLKARIRGGVIETEQKDIRMPEFSWAESNRGEALFQKGKMRLTMNNDGTLLGMAGGYRDWREIYGRDTFNIPSGGPTRETFYHQNQIGMFYALRRNADGIPDATTGQNTGISTAYRIRALPAFVVDPRQPVVIDQQAGERPYQERDAFMRALTTRTLQAPPPSGSGGGGYYRSTTPAPAPVPGQASNSNGATAVR